jgi:hypothetical protein
MALDGSVDHSQSETSNWFTKASTYEIEFNHFVSWCEQTTMCALHGQDVAQLSDSLARQADAQVIPDPNVSSVGVAAQTSRVMRFSSTRNLCYHPRMRYQA